MEYWGFKHVHGRIWSHLFLSEVALDAGDLMERLQISKALVSMSLNELIEYEVIHFAGKGRHGAQLYRPNLNLTDVITGVLRRRERRMLSRLASASRLALELPSSEAQPLNLSKSRLQALAGMVQAAEASLDAMLALSTADFAPWAQFDLSQARQFSES